MIFLGLVAVAFIGFAGPLVRIFSSDPGVVSMASTTLRTISYGYVFYAWGMVIAQAFNGAGDTGTPTMLNLLCFWVLQIPLAWLLAFRMGLGPNGIFIAIAIAQSALAVAGVLMFRRGKWKGTTV
jgi:Na+-driven multidrug efflux pump